jgi:hypothetical protein
LAIDNFVFDEQIRVHILAKHGIEDTLICKDYSNGLEQMPICVVNAVNNEGLPDVYILVLKSVFFHHMCFARPKSDV